MELKINREVLEIASKDRLLIYSIRKRRRKIVGHILRYPEKMHSTILERKRPPERPRNLTSIDKWLIVDTIRELKKKDRLRVKWDI